MKKILAIVIFTVSVVNILNAAVVEPVKATIEKNFFIHLPADVQLSDSYIVDISELPFKTPADAEKFFDMFSENVVNYKVMQADNTMILYLNKDIMPDWTLTDWNTYFENRALKMQVVYSEMFK
ncbi:MAG TPA: hypothetical protein VFM99_11015 [Chitinophagales bacterium]|nr:hypothetical protein [Chitinophagales bacterium]